MSLFVKKILKESVTQEIYQGIEGDISRLNYEGKGFLDYQEEEGMFLLIKVETNPNFRNQGIASKLLDDFFSLVDSNDGIISLTTFLEDGEKYLTKVIEKLKIKYPKLEFLD